MRLAVAVAAPRPKRRRWRGRRRGASPRRAIVIAPTRSPAPRATWAWPTPQPIVLTSGTIHMLATAVAAQLPPLASFRESIYVRTPSGWAATRGEDVRAHVARALSVMRVPTAPPPGKTGAASGTRLVSAARHVVADVVAGLHAFALRPPQSPWSAVSPVADTDVVTSDVVIDGVTGAASAWPSDLFCVAPVPARWDPTATCPITDAAVARLVGGDPDAIELWWRWVGLCLTRRKDDQAILLMAGASGAGKSTLIESTLDQLLPAGSCVHMHLHDLAERFGLAPLRHAQLAVIDEARVSFRGADGARALSRLLSISGRDALLVERKGVEGETMQLPTRIMISTNLPPAMADEAGAMRRRLRAIRIVDPITPTDTAIGRKMIAERDGHLARAVAALGRLLADDAAGRPGLPQPAASADLIDDMIAAGRPLDALVSDVVDEVCDVGDAVSIRVGDFVEIVRAFARARGGVHDPDEGQIGRALRRVVPSVAVARGPRGIGRERIYRGIGLRAGQIIPGFMPR